MTLPTVLFKYSNIDRVKSILLSKTVRFTQPKNFNDPFEFLPEIDSRDAKNEYLKILKESGEPPIITGENYKGFVGMMHGITKFFDDTLNAVGVLSLSSRCDIPLMWSHYSTNHCGAIIGFDPLCEAFRPNLPTSTINEFDECDSVIYSKLRCSFPGQRRRSAEFMFFKDANWSYEEEWRIIKSLSKLTMVKEGIYVKSFPTEAIRCVITGVRTKYEDELELKKILSAPEYSHVKRFSAKILPGEYGLDIVEDFKMDTKRLKTDDSINMLDLVSIESINDAMHDRVAKPRKYSKNDQNFY